MDLTYNPLALVNLSILQIHQNWKALLMAEKMYSTIYYNSLCVTLQHHHRLGVAKVISSQIQTRWDASSKI